MPGLGCASKRLTHTPPSCPLHFLDWHEIFSYLFCSLLFPLSVIPKVNIFRLLALLSGECHLPPARQQADRYLSAARTLRFIGKRVAKHLLVPDKVI